jgi:hypothetical protein
MLLSFLTMYLYKAGFSYKTTYGNKMNAEENMRLQLFSIKPRHCKRGLQKCKIVSLISLNFLLENMMHVSHWKYLY